ncbi:MAG: biotin transporter BioY [Methanoregulaceae archaeon]|jgi:biotin transport system substrate-specific component|nr:biotin transporter BioY [Methanoregulaceae archaeon]
MIGDLPRARRIAYSAAFIALITLGSWISIPFFPVPITLQTLFVLLAAAVLRRSAVIPVTMYVLLGAMGLPVFHNGIAGIGVLLGPTGGYLVGFIPAALVAGFAYEHSRKIIHVLGVCAATAAIYLSGLAWLVYSTGMNLVPAIIVGVLPFLAGDMVKAYAAYRIAERLP